MLHTVNLNTCWFYPGLAQWTKITVLFKKNYCGKRAQSPTAMSYFDADAPLLGKLRFWCHVYSQKPLISQLKGTLRTSMTLMTSMAFNDFVKLPDNLWSIFWAFMMFQTCKAQHSRHARPSKVSKNTESSRPLDLLQNFPCCSNCNELWLKNFFT